MIFLHYDNYIFKFYLWLLEKFCNSLVAEGESICISAWLLQRSRGQELNITVLRQDLYLYLLGYYRGQELIITVLRQDLYLYLLGYYRGQELNIIVLRQDLYFNQLLLLSFVCSGDLPEE